MLKIMFRIIFSVTNYVCLGYLLRQHFHCSGQMIFYRSPEYNPNPNITYSSFGTHTALVVSIALPSNKHHVFQHRRNNISHGTRVAPEEESTEEVIPLAIPYDSRRTVEHWGYFRRRKQSGRTTTSISEMGPSYLIQASIERKQVKKGTYRKINCWNST